MRRSRRFAGRTAAGGECKGALHSWPHDGALAQSRNGSSDEHAGRVLVFLFCDMSCFKLASSCRRKHVMPQVFGMLRTDVQSSCTSLLDIKLLIKHHRLCNLSRLRRSSSARSTGGRFARSYDLIDRPMAHGFNLNTICKSRHRKHVLP